MKFDQYYKVKKVVNNIFINIIYRSWRGKIMRWKWSCACMSKSDKRFEVRARVLSYRYKE